MLKDFLIFWIVFQLLLIGLSGAMVHNSFVNGSYEYCSSLDKKIPVFISVLFPLVWFLPEISLHTNYCNNKIVE